MEIILVLTYIGLNIFNYKEDKLYNTLNVTIGTYVVITLLNNFIAKQFGFYRVENKTQIIILIAMLFIYFGSWMRKKLECNRDKLNQVSMNQDIEIDKIFDNQRKTKIIYTYFIFCCFIRFVQIFIIVEQYGITYLGSTDFEKLNLSGIPSHLFLSIYPIAALLFYHSIKRKIYKPMILYILGLLISFLSFVKYNAIFYVIFTFVFCVAMNQELGKKLIVFFGVIIICLFVGNYILGFALRHVTKFGLMDYFRRLWDYIGGSIINGNHCIRFGENNIDYSSLDLLVASLFPLLIGIVSKFLGELNIIVPFHFETKMLSDFGDSSNVVGLLFNISYTGSILLFVSFCILQGWLIEGILIKIKRKNCRDKIFLYCMILTDVLMTFFANYFVLSTIWELIILSYLIPKILILNKRF